MLDKIHRGKALRRYLAILAVPVATHCAGSASSPMTTMPATDDVVVAVTNNTLARLRVHARYGEAEPLLLGEVSTNRTRTFNVPWKAEALRIGVRRADATTPDPRWSNNALTLSPRDSVEFTLTANARRTAEVTFRRVGTRGGL